MDAHDLLTVEQLAQMLHVQPSAIHSQRYRGEMPGSLGVKLGKRVFYRRSDLDAFIDQQIAREASARVLAGT